MAMSSVLCYIASMDKSPKQNALIQALRGFGGAILGAGTSRDATAGGQEYKRYVAEKEANSEVPVSRQEFDAGKR